MHSGSPTSLSHMSPKISEKSIEDILTEAIDCSTKAINILHTFNTVETKRNKHHLSPFYHKVIQINK